MRIFYYNSRDGVFQWILRKKFILTPYKDLKALIQYALYSQYRKRISSKKGPITVIKFEKISWPQFLGDWRHRNEERLEQPAEVYGAIRLPERATAGAAGYDFFAPYAFTLHPGEQITILTGLRACMPKDVVLILAPRSGQGIRHKLQLMNTVGIIDSDYQNADNEGHIMIALYNDHPDKQAVLKVEKGQAFAQGIFLPYLLTNDDQASASRTGGFGSTDEKNLDKN